MSNLFERKQKTATFMQGNQPDVKYSRSIANLLVVVIASAVNILLLVTNTDTYFLFSAFVPYFLAQCGMFYTGMFPEEYYQGFEEFEFLGQSFLITTVIVAAGIVLLYLLSWIFARKKKVGWLIFATVMFCIDTVAMLLLTDMWWDSIIDIVFHAWIIFSLISGIVCCRKMKNRPEEYQIEPINCAAEDIPQSNVLRMADTEVKSRILLEAEKDGYHIVYRRVKRTNELVVNGRVYDEYEAVVEYPHTLTAKLDGHFIEVGCNAASRMFIVFDGVQLAKKLRLI